MGCLLSLVRQNKNHQQSSLTVNHHHQKYGYQSREEDNDDADNDIDSPQSVQPTSPMISQIQVNQNINVNVMRMAQIPGLDLVMMGDDQGALYLLNTITHVIGTWEAHPGTSISSLCGKRDSDNNLILCSGGRDSSIRVWSISVEELAEELKSSFIFNRKTLKTINVRKEMHMKGGHTCGISAMTLVNCASESFDFDMHACLLWTGSRDGLTNIWDLSFSDTCLSSWKIDRNIITAMVSDQRGSLVIQSGEDQIIRIYDGDFTTLNSNRAKKSNHAIVKQQPDLLASVKCLDDGLPLCLSLTQSTLNNNNNDTSNCFSLLVGSSGFNEHGVRIQLWNLSKTIKFTEDENEEKEEQMEQVTVVVPPHKRETFEVQMTKECEQQGCHPSSVACVSWVGDQNNGNNNDTATLVSVSKDGMIKRWVVKDTQDGGKKTMSEEQVIQGPGEPTYCMIITDSHDDENAKDIIVGQCNSVVKSISMF